MLSLSGKSVLVLGLGVSGRSAANFCAARGARVVAADERAAGAIEGLETLEAGIERVVGHPFPDAAGFDLVVPSPGVAPARYSAAARRVWGEVELAFQALPVPIVAVTGTNGKSTTTRLVELMLRGAGLRARAAGNLGEPALSLVGEALDVAVLEVSSFQLETTEAFRPRVAVILNVTPDHLDRHGKDVAVLNFDDPNVSSLAAQARGRVLPFRTAGALSHGAWFDAGAVVLRDEGGLSRRISLDGLQLAGLHNLENTVAALAAAWAAGAEPERAAAALAGFRGLPHRMEEVARVAGVLYVNDSKATNPSAARRSLASSETPVVWIAGGRDKGLDFGPLAEAAAGRVRAAVLLGEAAGKLEDALAGHVESHSVSCLEQAVRAAARLARAGDVVLLAPACASQDQFRDFEERGERFRAAVAALDRGGRGS
jgi:UDP-N-acetylmuramoylalanine--D-glutamate ligase